MSGSHTGRQYNIYFGKNNRDDAAYEVATRLIDEKVDIRDLFKQVLLQIEDGSLKFDPKTMRLDASAQNNDLYRMVKEIHQIIKSGQLRLVSDGDTPASDGVPQVVVSREVMNAFNEMPD